MTSRINRRWLAEMQRQIDAGDRIDQVLPFPPSARSLIAALAAKGRAFKVVNLGAGVKRVTTDVGVCPKCNGTGEC